MNNASLLITGGTGSCGKALVARILNDYPDIRRLVIFSRDELKQFEMDQEFPASKYPAIRYFLGDVRDEARLRRALEGIDYVIHAAALKQVPAAEYNPFECIKTNILGSQNVIEACFDTDVKKVIALSTDKAAAPGNLYGATKLCADKLFVAANNVRGNRDLGFSVVRYGNVMGSRGSVIPFFLKEKHKGVLPITDPRMTRFNITPNEGTEMILWALKNGTGSEIFVPKIPSYRIGDVATAIGPDCKQEIVGFRPGEKLHEEMITAADSYSTIDLGEYYAILPPGDQELFDAYLERTNGKPVAHDFCYHSATNEHFLTVQELRDLIETEQHTF